jgi:hypothetical protein
VSLAPRKRAQLIIRARTAASEHNQGVGVLLSSGAVVVAAADDESVGVAVADDVRAALVDDALDDALDDSVGSGVADGVAGAVVGVPVLGAGVDDDGAAFWEPAFARSPTVVDPEELDPVTMADTGRCPISSMPVTMTIAATNTAAAPAARRMGNRRDRAGARRGSSAAGS